MRRFDSISRLQSLKRDVEEILQAAVAAPVKVAGAINWGNLHCCQTAECCDDQGREYLEALIEEAAPDAGELHLLVLGRLLELGWSDVVIRTEW